MYYERKKIGKYRYWYLRWRDKNKKQRSILIGKKTPPWPITNINRWFREQGLSSLKNLFSMQRFYTKG